MNDNYSAASGQGIYGGRFNLPTWLLNQPVNTWGTIPTANALTSLNPMNDPLINPNYPAKPEWDPANGSFLNMSNAWCGWVYDYIRHRLRTGLSGGHADRAGNDEYGIDINQESPVWFRMRLPSGAIGNLLTTNDGQEASGDYADGQPRAIHSYNKQVFVPDIGLVVAMQGNTSWSAQSGPNRVLKYNHDGLFTGSGATNSGLNGQTSGAGACYDPSRNCIYVRGTGTSAIQKYNIDTNSWSQVGSSLAWSGYSALLYLPEHDCLLIFNAFLTNGFCVFDLVTNQYHYPTVTGTAVGMAKPRGHCQPHLIRDGEVAFWDNESNTTQINKMTFASNPRSDAWQISQYPVAASNTVVPTVRTANGTYGRFFHDPKLKIMGVINGVDQPIYFYRYS